MTWYQLITDLILYLPYEVMIYDSMISIIMCIKEAFNNKIHNISTILKTNIY